MRRCSRSPSVCCRCWLAAARRRRSRSRWWRPPIRWRSRPGSTSCGAAARRSMPRSPCRWCWAWSSRSPRASAAAASCSTTTPRRAASPSMTAARPRRPAPRPTMFLDADGKPLPFREAVASGLSVGVPGARAHARAGAQGARQAAVGAICSRRRSRWRAKASPVPPRLAAWLETIKRFADEPAARAIYFNADGTPEEAGEPIVNPALADTMRCIAEQGARVPSTRAPIADEMVARVHGHTRPGTLSLADLAGYQPIKREPVCGPYRVWIVCGMPPPSSGGIAILQMLGLLEPFDLWQDKPNDLRALHLIAEASRLAFADRDRYVADPAFVPVPVAGLLSPAYIAERRKLISDRPQHGPTPGKPVAPPGYVERGTSHMTHRRSRGNAVAFTTTIEAPFGAADDGARLHAEQRADRFLAACPSATASRSPTGSSRASGRARRCRPPSCSTATAGWCCRSARPAARASSATRLQALIGMLDWNLSTAGRARPAAGRQHERPDRAGGQGAPLPAQADALRALGHEVQVRRHEGGLTGHPPRRRWLGRRRRSAARWRRQRRMIVAKKLPSVLLRSGEDRRVRAGHPGPSPTRS